MKMLLIILKLQLVNVLLGKRLIRNTSITLLPLYLVSRNSASCTHVSAILHALVAMTNKNTSRSAPTTSSQSDCGSDILPVTSYLCQWKVPKKRKESTLPMSAAVFEKHDYQKKKKRRVSFTEDFDPRPAEYWGTAPSLLPALLDDVSGESLGISLLFDSRYCQKTLPFTDTKIPAVSAIKTSVEAFKGSLKMSAEKLREIEQNTREQRDSPLWFSVRRYRITASRFGEIFRRRINTPPDRLVLSILEPRSISSVAIDWGVKNESKAIQFYISYQHVQGLDNLTVGPCGFFISESHSFLGATPDGTVYDPSDMQQPFGFIEVKCPYTQRNSTPAEACSSPGFCCKLESHSDGTQTLKLRETIFILPKFKDRWVWGKGHGVTLFCLRTRRLA